MRATAGIAGMNARDDSWSSGRLRRAVTEPLIRKICTNPSSHSSRLAMGGLVPRAEQKVLVNPRGVSQIGANTFLPNWDSVRLLATARSDRASKPPTSSSLADKKRVDSLLLGTAARDPASRR
jgi:hypothetical protein